LTTRDTVLRLTPESAATSFIVARIRIRSPSVRMGRQRCPAEDSRRRSGVDSHGTV
jgi:hypothetical protein